MASRQKVKGDNFEREAQRYLQSKGVATYKIPRSGAGILKDDLVIGKPHVQRISDLRIECKIRNKFPDWITGFLDSSSLCVFREKRGKRIWCMTDEIFVRLATAYERERNMSDANDLLRLRRIIFNITEERRLQLSAERKAQRQAIEEEAA